MTPLKGLRTKNRRALAPLGLATLGGFVAVSCALEICN